ncbi:MAG: hypothetical protein PHU71_05370 [Candidatus Gracilibacteria bacterium]|nr:hypothetical protein [Candidatus Gracilibacteria bacterium]
MAMNKLLIAIGFEQGASLEKLILQHFPFSLELPQAEKFQDLNEILRARFALQPEFAKVKNALSLPRQDLLREKNIQARRKLESHLCAKFMQKVFALSKKIQQQEKAKSAEFNLEELREVLDLLDSDFDKLLAKLNDKDQQQYLSEVIDRIDVSKKTDNTKEI